MWHLSGTRMDQPIWEWGINPVGSNPDVEGIHRIEIFMTTTLCGFVRRVRGEQDCSSFCHGHFQLALLDRRTGETIHSIGCFSAAFNFGHEETMAMPLVAASGNTVCLIGVNYEEQNKVICLRVEGGDDNKRCRVRRVTSDFESIMLRWCIASEESMQCKDWWRKGVSHIIDVTDVDILGVVDERVVVGKFTMKYKGPSHHEEETESVVLFTIDTDRFFTGSDEDDSSSALSTAFNLPLINEVGDLLHHCRPLSFWPYYESSTSGRGEPVLRGVVEFNNYYKLISHDFKTKLDWDSFNDNNRILDKSLSDISQDLKKVHSLLFTI